MAALLESVKRSWKLKIYPIHKQGFVNSQMKTTVVQVFIHLSKIIQKRTLTNNTHREYQKFMNIPFTEKPKKCSHVTKKYSDYGRYEFIQDYFPKVRLKLNCTKNFNFLEIYPWLMTIFLNAPYVAMIQARVTRNPL